MNNMDSLIKEIIDLASEYSNEINNDAKICEKNNSNIIRYDGYESDRDDDVHFFSKVKYEKTFDRQIGTKIANVYSSFFLDDDFHENRTKQAISIGDKDNVKPVHVCSNCYRKVNFINKCNKCNKEIYCSNKCQQKDWHNHKKYCKK